MQLHFSLPAFTGFLGTDLGGRRESAGPSHCSTDSTSLTTVSSPKPRREPGKNKVPVGTDAVSECAGHRALGPEERAIGTEGGSCACLRLRVLLENSRTPCFHKNHSEAMT